MDIKILENLILVTIERGNVWKRQDQIIYMSIIYDLGLLKSGKVELQSTIDRGNLRYGETIHDRTGKLVTENLQEQAHSENFVMGSDATEFVNQVRDQVRNRQKRMSSIAESCTEHSII